MDKYIITNPFPNSKYIEIQISSDNLIYSEINNTHSGCQVRNMRNQDEIHNKCKQISDLIREIDKLNKN